MSRTPERVFLALGSNKGDRAVSLARAIAALQEDRRVALEEVEMSSLYETPALLPENAPSAWNVPFLNQVIFGMTSAEPILLLQAIKDIEKTLGRVSRGHWGPREIDIDILTYGREVIRTRDLAIPHPLMHQRAFVLVPLAELDSGWCYPGAGRLRGKSAEFLLSQLPIDERKLKAYAP